jgi:hypothetical protein
LTPSQLALAYVHKKYPQYKDMAYAQVLNRGGGAMLLAFEAGYEQGQNDQIKGILDDIPDVEEEQKKLRELEAE